MRQQRNPLALTGAVVLILAGVIGGLVALGANHLPGQILAILAIVDGVLLFRESPYLEAGLSRPEDSRWEFRRRSPPSPGNRTQ